MLLIITSIGNELFRNVNIDNLEWSWTLKILILSDFLAVFGWKRVNCDEMDEDRPRLSGNRNCHRLSRLMSIRFLVQFCRWLALIIVLLGGHVTHLNTLEYAQGQQYSVECKFSHYFIEFVVCHGIWCRTQKMQNCTFCSFI